MAKVGYARIGLVQWLVEVGLGEGVVIGLGRIDAVGRSEGFVYRLGVGSVKNRSDNGFIGNDRSGKWSGKCGDRSKMV